MSLHPAPVVLERLTVDDLPSAERLEVERHLAGCGACAQYLESLQLDHAKQLTAVPPELFASRWAKLQAQAHRPRRWLPWVALAVAASLLLVVFPFDSSQSQLKGIGVRVQRKRDANIGWLAPNDRIRAGDALRTVVTLAHPTPVAAWFLDRTGRVDVLVEGGAVTLPAGESALPGSAVVEAPCREGWLVVGTGSMAVEATLEQMKRTRAPAAGTTAFLLQCE